MLHDAARHALRLGARFRREGRHGSVEGARQLSAHVVHPRLRLAGGKTEMPARCSESEIGMESESGVARSPTR